MYEYIHPKGAAKRMIAKQQLKAIKEIDVRNSGYDAGGASRKKNSMKGFIASSRTPQEDIDLNLDILRQRSRSLFMTAPVATSAIKTNRTNVIGSGLKLKSRIDFQRLGISQEDAVKWERMVESEFALWADSKFCDSQQLNNFYELQQIAFMGWLINGDCFAAIEHVNPLSYMPYGLRLHLIESDRISNPGGWGDYLNLNEKWENGNRIYNGVEIDDRGTVVAYHICNSYPNSKLYIDKKWVRVKAIGDKTGNPNILHIMDAERAEQYRGVPYLAPVIVTLRQLTQYTEAELTAAVINGIFSVFVTTQSGNEDMDFSGAMDDDDKVGNGGDDLQLGAGLINFLGPNEKVEIADAKRPNVNFDSFASAMCKYIGAALEIPYELLVKNFTASYSASRAALLEAFKAFKMRRTWFANDFCQPIFELWLSEAIARGRIQAPSFFNDPSIKKAWCGSEWNGPAQGQIDPMKEVNAARIRVQEGFSTRERETIEINGGDFGRNVDQALIESKKIMAVKELLSDKKGAEN